MSLYEKVTMGGVEVYTDKYMERYGDIYYISMFGAAEAVKAVTAGLIGKEGIRIGWKYKYRRKDVKYTFNRKKIEHISHCVVYVKEFFLPKYIQSVAVLYGENSDEIKEKFYQLVNSKTTIPLLPEWKDAVYDAFQSEMVNIDCFGFGNAAEVEIPSDKELEELIMQNISHFKALAA